MKWKGVEIPWTTVFVFTTLVLYAIVGILGMIVVSWVYPWFITITITFLSFLVAGAYYVEWISQFF